MIIIILFFTIIFFYEWNYLKNRKRKKRTFLIALGIMGVSFCYCISTYLFKYSLNPNELIEILFRPLQEKIIG